MSEERGLAFIQAAVARAMIKCEGMKAENAERERRGMSPPYGEGAFLSLIDEEGIGWNAVITTLNEHRS